MDRSVVILICIVVYMMLCIGIGIWAMRRTKSTRDFFMAGRDLGVMVTALAIFSTTLSGFGFVGGPGLVYSMGMSSVWIVLTATMGFCLGSILLAKRLRMFAGLFDTVSLPDAVAARYSSEGCRLMTAIAILLGVMAYLATQILAMARVLQDLLGNSAIGDIGLAACIGISVAVLLFYSVTGGIVASVYTDMIQGSVMVVAGVLIFITALFAFDGGPSEAVRTIMEDDAEAVGPWGTLGILGCLSWYFTFVLGGAGQPHIITKHMMIRSPEDARRILPLSLAGYCLAGLLWIGIGLAMRALVINESHGTLETADAAAPQFLQFYAFPLLAGVVFAALFAAIMSTADAFLNIGTAAVMHDIPQAMPSLLEKAGLSGLAARARRVADFLLASELAYARVCTVIIGVVAGLVALYCGSQQELVALLGAFGWGTFAAALVPTIAIGFNWKRATPLAAIVAISVSLLINVVIEVLDVAFHIEILPYGFHGYTVSLLVSVSLFFGISLASRPPTLDPDVDKLMDI